MFNFLKKKLTSWIKKPDGDKEKKKVEKKQPKIKEKKQKNKKKEQINGTKKPKEESQKKEKSKEIIKEGKLEEAEESIEDNKDEKEGFFRKLFGSKKEDENTEEATKEEKSVETQENKEADKVDKSEEIEEDKPNFFTKILKKITSSELKKEDFDDAFEELEITLLENNVALEAVDKIRATLEKDLVGQQVKKEAASDKILSALKDSILSVLQEPPDLIEQINKHDGIYTIIFFGINGTGKTTSIAKIAHLLKERGVSCVLAAADTFRAASIEQLKEHASRLDVPIISSGYGADPASVIFESKKYASSHKIKVVLADTAGRMYTKDNLIKEMEKIIRVNQPQLKIFVGESITGNDAIEQARTFNEAIGIDGIILSKADIDEKAGTILSVSHVTSKPIYFLGTGQNYEDLIVFTKKTVLQNLGLE